MSGFSAFSVLPLSSGLGVFSLRDVSSSFSLSMFLAFPRNHLIRIESTLSERFLFGSACRSFVSDFLRPANQLCAVFPADSLALVLVHLVFPKDFDLHVGAVIR